MSSSTTTDEILVERAVLDFEDGLAHLRRTLREKHGRLLGGTLDALIMGAVTALGVRSRMREDVRHLLSIAHRVNAGEDPRALAEQEIDRVLRLKQKMHLIAREDDPEFQRIRALSLEVFAQRLPDLARMAAVRDPVDYPDIVRRAFPDRAYVDAMVEENARAVHLIVDHLEKHPQVLHAPRALAGALARTAREMVDWKLADVRRAVAEIYAAPPPP